MNFWSRCPSPELYLQKKYKKYLTMELSEVIHLCYKTRHSMNCYDCLIKHHQIDIDKLPDIPSKGFMI